MNPIIQLNQPLINKIAAGEVVERPLSVVKELIENAIDAGASNITVEIADGGLSAIRVTDNGRGIPADQILLAFARHATSKISSLEDLFEVGTLGFRGEALSSIAAVSQVEMITKTSQQEMGVRVEIHGGEVVNRQVAGVVDGTTAIVNNLFYNTPARRKFLKKPATEAGYIADCLQKLALGNPGLTIRYINNGQIAFQTNGNGDLKTAMLNIYGRETAAQLVGISGQLDDMGLHGFIGKPAAARGNRQRQSFFINGRLIQSRLLTQAVEEATKTMLPVGKFPVYALSLSIPFDEVDVNVHPTKMDVRFQDDEGVMRFVRGVIREALTESNLIPEWRESGARSLRAEKSSAGSSSPGTLHHRELDLPQRVYSDVRPHQVDTNPAEAHLSNINQTGLRPSQSPLRQLSASNGDGGEATTRACNDERRAVAGAHNDDRSKSTSDASQPLSLREVGTSDAPLTFFTEYHIIDLIFGTYWLVTQGESLYLIDQHAAHERVLYEEILAKTVAGPIQAQQLLVPISLRLTPREASLLKDNLALFARFGFEIADLNENSPQSGAAITTVPYFFKGPATTNFFTDLLDKLSEAGFSRAGVFAHKTEAIAMAACKTAVKGGDNLTKAEARELIEKMLSLENPFTCPHGRPTIIEITRRELERRFKRG